MALSFLAEQVGSGVVDGQVGELDDVERVDALTRVRGPGVGGELVRAAHVQRDRFQRGAAVGAEQVIERFEGGGAAAFARPDHCAFAVVVALGEQGLPVALAMLAIVLLANNTIQNFFEPFAFGRSLRLHPLVVLVATTAGTLLFGLMGALLAAPLASAFLNAVRVLREAGLFEGAAPSEPPSSQ